MQNKVHGKVSCEWIREALSFTDLFSTNKAKIFVKVNNLNQLGCVYIVTYGGGLLQGDEVNLEFKIGERCKCMITSIGNTKVYKCTEELVSKQRMTTTLSTDSTLFVLPDPVLCFKDSSYYQIQQFFLTSTSNLVLLDWITSGRVACGEKWMFKSYKSINEIYIDGQLILKDSLLLSDNIVTLQEQFGSFHVLGILVLIGPSLCSHIQDILKKINHKISIGTKKENTQIDFSTSELTSNGLIIRIAGEAVEDVRKWIQVILAGVDKQYDLWKMKKTWD